MARCVLSILGLEPRRIGGVESSARELSRQLGDLGWTSVLVFLTPPPEAVRRFLDLPNVIVEVLEDNVSPSLRVLRNASALLRKHRPDILHLQFTSFLSAYPWLARLRGVRKTFFTDQGSHPEGFVPAPAAFWKRVAGRIVTWPMSRVVCISDYNMNCCVTRGYVSPDRVCRLYNSVDTRRESGDPASFRARHAIPPDRAVVLQAGALTPDKGVPDLLEAARLVVAAEPSVHFVLAGDGPLRNESARRAEQTGIGDHITWTGLLSDPIGEGAYAAADVVCQLSRWQEGFGYTIAEAMACGKPVVGARAGAIPELIDDGISGFVAAPRSAAEVADRVLLLLRDPQLRLRMGSAARLIAQQRFDLSRNIAELVSLFGIAPRPADREARA
jgi:glycosyltransferase involved in cell wall biosynthesis